jgi:hypothetical protein
MSLLNDIQNNGTLTMPLRVIVLFIVTWLNVILWNVVLLNVTAPSYDLFQKFFEKEKGFLRGHRA